MSTTDESNYPPAEPVPAGLERRSPDEVPPPRGTGDRAHPDWSTSSDPGGHDDPSAGTWREADADALRESLSAAATQVAGARPARGRRVRLPLILFVATCFSTFWVGALRWSPLPFPPSLRQTLVAHWSDGLTYMVCLLAILLTHEMGHFLATLRYRIPASFPYFIPFPISPIGTMGAVIGMDGLRADRRAMFDIGLAGPLAGLLVAVPVMCVGIARLDLTQMAYGPYAVDTPLFARLALYFINPAGYAPGQLIWFSQLNPYFMAGWVGFLITGLNMMPVSQLDGGHVVYTLFGKRAHWVARVFLLSAIAFVVISHQWNWAIMIALVLLIGPDHPPTKNDQMPLGRVRTILGLCSLTIPIFCFAPWLLIFPD
jgi:membrane-associated protease RseP (regulator of RpoE activity)